MKKILFILSLFFIAPQLASAAEFCYSIYGTGASYTEKCGFSVSLECTNEMNNLTSAEAPYGATGCYCVSGCEAEGAVLSDDTGVFATPDAPVLGSSADESGVDGSTTSNPPKPLDNPLGDISTLDGLIEAVVRIIVGVAWAIAAFFLILSGFRFVKAQGNPEELKKAKTTFMYTIIGIVIIAGSSVIIKVLREFITEVTG